MTNLDASSINANVTLPSSGAPFDGAAPPLTIALLKTVEDVRHHRQLWNWPGSRDSHLDLFLYRAKARGTLLSPYVLVAYRGNTPEAMLVGKLEHRKIPAHIGFLGIWSPRLRVLTFVYEGLRGSANSETLQGFLNEVLKTLDTGEADVVAFEPLALDSGLFQCLSALPNRWQRGFCSAGRNLYRMHLPTSSESLHLILSSKQRSNYLRKGRKLERDFSGNIRLQWYTQASAEMYRDLEFIAVRSYQRGLRVGFEDTPELRGFWELAGSKGWLRVCILYVQDNPCAFFSGMVQQGVLCGDLMAYDRRFASYSPGMYLLLRAFGQLCDRPGKYGIREINLGPGDSYLKTLLSSSRKRECSVHLYPPVLRGIVLNALFSLVFFLDGLAKDSLARGNPLATTVKRIRRGRANRNLEALGHI